MIPLTKLDGQVLWVNPHQLETLEERPGTTSLHFLSGKLVVVQETALEVQSKILAYRRALGIFKNEE